MEPIFDLLKKGQKRLSLDQLKQTSPETHQKDIHSNERQSDCIALSDETNEDITPLKLSSDTNKRNINQTVKSNEIPVPNGTQNKRFSTERVTFAYNLNDNKELMAKYRGTPWIPLRQHYGFGLVGLHQEIEDFYNYMKPKPEEEFMRSDLVKRITRIVKDVLPNVRVDYFGSFRTGLYLPTSDIDMVVIGKWEPTETFPFFILEKKLLESGIADESTIKVLDKAVVPIIKLTDIQTRVRVDINFNFNTFNGIQSSKLIKDFKRRFPNLPKLYLVVKQFLLQRNLMEVFTGGISSYLLLLMVISFIQLHPHIHPKDWNVNLGILLLEFLQLYGIYFNYNDIGIRIKNGGSYVTKRVIEEQMGADYKSSMLCVEDPLNSKNDIGKSSFGVNLVKRAFGYAFDVLKEAIGPLSPIGYQSQSILGQIIRISDEVVDYRQEICKKFAICLPKKNIANHLINVSMNRFGSSSMCSQSNDYSDNEFKNQNILREISYSVRNSSTNSQRHLYRESVAQFSCKFKPQNYSKCEDYSNYNRNQNSYYQNKYRGKTWKQKSRKKFTFSNHKDIN